MPSPFATLVSLIVLFCVPSAHADGFARASGAETTVGLRGLTRVSIFIEKLPKRRLAAKASPSALARFQISEVKPLADLATEWLRTAGVEAVSGVGHPEQMPTLTFSVGEDTARVSLDEWVRPERDSRLRFSLTTYSRTIKLANDTDAPLKRLVGLFLMDFRAANGAVPK